MQVNALKTPEFSERLFGMGTNVVGGTPQEYAAHIRREVVKMREAIKLSGARGLAPARPQAATGGWKKYSAG